MPLTIKDTKLSRKGNILSLSTIPMVLGLIIFGDGSTLMWVAVFAIGLFLGCLMGISNRKLKPTWGDSYFLNDKTPKESTKNG